MVVSVTLTLIDELLVIPWQEKNRVLWFYILRMSFFVQHGFLFTGSSIVTYQLRMILITIQFNHVNALFVWTPADIGKIAVCWISGLQVDSFFSGWVKYTNSYLVASHSCHWILVRFKCSDTSRSVDLWIVSYHALIHAIECKQVSLWTPENTSIDTKFITVNTLSAKYSVRFVGYLNGFAFVWQHIKIIVNSIS